MKQNMNVPLPIVVKSTPILKTQHGLLIMIFICSLSDHSFRWTEVNCTWTFFL